MFATIQKWWTGHGTKILGGVVLLIGGVQDVLPLIQQADSKHALLWAIVTGIGAAVIKRGFTNSASISGQPT